MFRKCCQSVLLVLAASWVLLGWGVTVCALIEALAVMPDGPE